MTAVTDELDGAQTVLLSEPSMGGGRTVCTDLLTDASNPSVLFVSYTRQPDDCVGQLAGADTGVGKVGVITVGDTAGGSDRGDVISETVSAPSDLTGLGIEIGQFLTEWDSTVVCFDSLTSMLQYVDFETAYEFLHTVLGQVRSADARAHFHIDPDAHDAEDVAAITSLFDARVSVGDRIRVRTRDLRA